MLKHFVVLWYKCVALREIFQRPGALLKKDPFFHTLCAFLDAYDALCHKIAPSHKKVVTYAECVSRDCHLKDNQLIGHDWLSKMNKIFFSCCIDNN